MPPLILPDDVDLGDYGRPFDSVDALAAYLMASENAHTPAFRMIRRHILFSNDHGDSDGLYFEMVFDALKIAGLEPSIDRIFNGGRGYALRWCVVRQVVRAASGMIGSAS